VLQSGLGGVNISSSNPDLNLFFSNPALLLQSGDKQLALNYTNYLADIYFLSSAYSFDVNNVGSFGASIQYLDYGDFEGLDDSGNNSNSFNAQDFVFSIGHARSFGNFSVGMVTKIANAQIESFGSTAWLFDFGSTFKHPTADFQVGKYKILRIE
jgi:hypothetical protein